MTCDGNVFYDADADDYSRHNAFNEMSNTISIYPINDIHPCDLVFVGLLSTVGQKIYPVNKFD